MITNFTPAVAPTKPIAPVVAAAKPIAVAPVVAPTIAVAPPVAAAIAVAPPVAAAKGVEAAGPSNMLATRLTNTGFVERITPGAPMAGLFVSLKDVTVTIFQAMDRIQAGCVNGEIPGAIPSMLNGCLDTVMECAMVDSVNNPAAVGLSIDELAAIKLYTMPLYPEEASVYHLVNTALRDENRNFVKPFAQFIWLLMHALRKAPRFTRALVYRGVKQDLSSDYSVRLVGMKVTFRSFTSCAKTVDVLTNPMFLGMTGARTIFNIELTSNRARDISAISMMSNEGEVLLPPNSKFTVMSVFGPSPDGLLTVQLLEIPPTDPIMDF